MTGDDIATFCSQRVELFRRQDAAAMAALHTDDCVVESPLAGGVAQGREAIRHVYQVFFDAFSFSSVHQEDLLVDGDRATLLVHMDGTNRGGLMGLQPSGRSLSVSIVSLCEFRDGLIARERRIYDFTGLLVQVGAIKAKPV